MAKLSKANQRLMAEFEEAAKDGGEISQATARELLAACKLAAQVVPAGQTWTDMEGHRSR